MAVNNQKSTESNYFAIAALIFAFLIPIIGVILAIAALIMNRKTKNSNVLAIIALVLGGIGTIVSILFLSLVLWATKTNGGQTFVDSVAQYGAASRAEDQHNALKQYYKANGYYPPEVTSTSVNQESLLPPEGYVFRYNPTPIGCEKCTGYTLEVLNRDQTSVFIISDMSPMVDKSNLER